MGREEGLVQTNGIGMVASHGSPGGRGGMVQGIDHFMEYGKMACPRGHLVGVS